VNGTYEIESVRALMTHAWDHVETFHATAKIRNYNVGAPTGPNPHPPWQFLDPAFPGGDTAMAVTATWQHPDAWQHRRRTPAGTQVEYAAIGGQWQYSVDGVVTVQGSAATRWGKYGAPTFDMGNPNVSPLDNRRRCRWINPALWVDSVQLHLVWAGAIGCRDVYQLIAYPDPAALHANRGLWDMLQIEDETIYEGSVYQLWVDRQTGFFHRLTAESDNGRAWDVIVDTLALNQPLEDAR
jgi:hypothetical protein